MALVHASIAKAKDLHLPFVIVLFVMLIRFGFFQIVTEWNHNQYAALLKYDATLSCVHNHQLMDSLSRISFAR